MIVVNGDQSQTSEGQLLWIKDGKQNASFDMSFPWAGCFHMELANYELSSLQLPVEYMYNLDADLKSHKCIQAENSLLTKYTMQEPTNMVFYAILF